VGFVQCVKPGYCDEVVVGLESECDWWTGAAVAVTLGVLWSWGICGAMPGEVESCQKAVGKVM
jgi:hypothetical protein